MWDEITFPLPNLTAARHVQMLFESELRWNIVREFTKNIIVCLSFENITKFLVYWIIKIWSLDKKKSRIFHRNK